MTTQIRREWPEDIPAYCRTAPGIAGRSHHRQLGYWDPKAKKFNLIDTCYGTHHLQFDKNGVLWSSGDSYVLGWFDPAKYDPARPETEQTAGGFAEVKVDTNGDNVADQSIVGFNYGIIPNDTDGQHLDGAAELAGSDHPLRPARREVRAILAAGAGLRPPRRGRRLEGDHLGRDGRLGHLGRFDRSKCTQTWGDGKQCAEGWTFYKPPGPLMSQSNPASETTADLHYYIWVNRHNASGLGKDTVILNGTNSDSLQIFNQKTEKWITMRVPYPLNAYQRGLDGRIDNAKTGWKGRGLWFNDGLDPIIHNEVQHRLARPRAVPAEPARPVNHDGGVPALRDPRRAGDAPTLEAPAWPPRSAASPPSRPTATPPAT